MSLLTKIRERLGERSNKPAKSELILAFEELQGYINSEEGQEQIKKSHEISEYHGKGLCLLGERNPKTDDSAGEVSLYPINSGLEVRIGFNTKGIYNPEEISKLTLMTVRYSEGIVQEVPYEGQDDRAKSLIDAWKAIAYKLPEALRYLAHDIKPKKFYKLDEEHPLSVALWDLYEAFWRPEGLLGTSGIGRIALNAILSSDPRADEAIQKIKSRERHGVKIGSIETSPKRDVIFYTVMGRLGGSIIPENAPKDLYGNKAYDMSFSLEDGKADIMEIGLSDKESRTILDALPGILYQYARHENLG
ncbi:hypothetical protein HYV81_03080 [Candidatus Woesearchaeota archaeon]|nr:hypothetical protein [Candidatus Woesearchaeota archaeon]